MKRLSDDHLLELLQKARQHKVSIEFIQLLEEEVVSRNLDYSKFKCF